MDRKQFLKTCGIGCLAGGSLLLALQGCGSSQMLTREIKGADMLVPLADFEMIKNGVRSYKKYVIVRNEILKFPICVYRTEDGNYTALLMECTHQGAELQVFGNKLQCPSHGSEFTNTGQVASGPAYLDLRNFPVTIENDQLKISLRK